MTVVLSWCLVTFLCSPWYALFPPSVHCHVLLPRYAYGPSVHRSFALFLLTLLVTSFHHLTLHPHWTSLYSQDTHLLCPCFVTWCLLCHLVLHRLRHHPFWWRVYSHESTCSIKMAKQHKNKENEDRGNTCVQWAAHDKSLDQWKMLRKSQSEMGFWNWLLRRSTSSSHVGRWRVCWRSVTDSQTL